jgi:Rrf2 family protein
MYLSRPAEYGLRAMTYLARMDSSRRVRTKDLSEAIDVPAPFLSKIMRKLTAVGILDAQKGHHGGFLLARSPEEVRFIDIMRAVDFEPGDDHCLFGLKNCDGNNPCPLHKEWGALKGQIEEWARTHTLADTLED